MAKYLVTGGAGFIGSNISKELVGLGHEVTVFDNFSTGKKENLEKIPDKIKIIEGDLRDLELVKKAFRGIEYVLHEAALPSVQRSVEDPAGTSEVNIMGTVNALIAARDNGIKRFVYAASSSAYGDTPTLPKKEEMKENPLSPYATGKLAGEHFCKVFAGIFKLETICLRYFNVFGPNQDPRSHYAAVIPKFITMIMKNEPPVIYGDGEQSRDFSFVENVVSANVLAATTANKEAIGRTMNIACGEAFSLNQMVKMINEIVGKDIKPRYEEGRAGDIKHSLADISVAGKLIGFRPKVTFRAGLAKTIDWYKARSAGK